MPVTYESRSAYKEHRASGRLGNQAQKILNDMIPGAAYSRRELVQLTGLELSSICGRVNELLSIGMLEEGSPRKCSITGKTVCPVRKGLI